MCCGFTDGLLSDDQVLESSETTRTSDLIEASPSARDGLQLKSSKRRSQPLPKPRVRSMASDVNLGPSLPF